MNKGFTLLEIIVYISLISILMVGIFSYSFDFLYRSQKTSDFTEDNYKNLIKNYHD